MFWDDFILIKIYIYEKWQKGWLSGSVMAEILGTSGLRGEPPPEPPLSHPWLSPAQFLKGGGKN